MPPGGSQSVDTTGLPMVVISYLLTPTSQSQCRNGGWRSFSEFKSERQCVAFVMRRGRAGCLAERAKIGVGAFRARYGLGRYHLYALRRCIQRASG